MKTLISYLSLATLMLTFSYAVGTQQKLNQQYEAAKASNGKNVSTIQTPATVPVMKADLAGSGILDARNWKKSNTEKEVASR
ncbi:MAG TPA: hypothetical protein VNS32_24560 [Flavisolibacter sp.]|nr:hypothetical protein [Flavisolibacter sp.]